MLKEHTLAMSRVVRFPKHSASASDAATDPRSREIAEEIAALLRTLSEPEQDRVLRMVTGAIRPIETPRAGEVLGTVVRLMKGGSQLTVDTVKRGVASEGVEATSKEIYNALGYLTRKGHVKRIGYGRYVVDGVGIVTSDDLGGEPARYEDD